MTFGPAMPALSQDLHGHTPAVSGMPQGVPFICANPTVTSVRSGVWSHPGTWSTGKVPVTNDKVLIALDHKVTYDVQSDAKLTCIEVQGHLAFATDVNTRIKVGTVMVRENGYLEVGSTAKPVAAHVRAEVMIADQPIDGEIDPGEVGTGIIGLGRVTMHGALKTPTFVRLSREPLAGETTLALEQPVEGWKIGDHLVIPDTRQLQEKEWGNKYRSQAEKVQIASLMGSKVTLAAPLIFSHKGARNGAGKLELLPHIGNVSRNVLVRSENPEGTRGHTIFISRADVDLRYTEFRDLGRTRMGVLENTQFDSEGRTVKIGTNQIGRYAVHFHHNFGPKKTPANGYQFTVIGNAVVGTAKWGITVHQSHYGLVQHNVVYDTRGAGIVTEDGNESFNVFDHNFSMRSAGSGKFAFASGYAGALPDLGGEGAAFWFRGPNNYIRNNVGANADEFAFGLPTGSPGSIMRIPALKGADTSNPNESVRLDLGSAPVLEFANNEAYGAMQTGVVWTWDGTISNFVVWNASRHGITGQPIKNLTVDKLTVRGDASVLLDEIENPIGVWLTNYASKTVILRNADVQGVRVGVSSPFFYNQTPDSGQRGGSLLVEEGYFRAYVGIAVATAYRTNATEHVQLKNAVVRRSLFEPLDVPTMKLYPSESISMNYGMAPRDPEPRDPVLVYDYNKQPGNDFKVYYSYQAPTTVAPCHDIIPGIGGWVCKLE